MEPMNYFIVVFYFCKSIYVISAEDDVGIENLLGRNIKGDQYNESGYALSSTARSGDDLKCDFESNCCWENVKPPGDQLQFVLFEGDPDKDKMQQIFGTTDGPSGKYIVVATTLKPSPNDEAHFISCPLTCANDEIKVSIRYWITKVGKLRVCLRDIKGGPMLNCQVLPKSSQPGPTEVSFPPMQNIHVVVVASDFLAKSVVMIDDIQVRTSACESTTFLPSIATTPLPSSPPVVTDSTPSATARINDPSINSEVPSSNQIDKNSQLCKAIVCNFEDGTSCSYQSKPTSAVINSQAKSWELASGLYRNPATGIRKPGEGIICLGVYLKPRDIATIETTADFVDDRVVKFLVYKVADNIELKGCCDDQGSCPYSTQTKVQLKNYNQWQKGSFQCPKGTKKIIFQGNNVGDNEGAIGLDDISLYVPNGDVPDNVQQSAC